MFSNPAESTDSMTGICIHCIHCQKYTKNMSQQSEYIRAIILI